MVGMGLLVHHVGTMDKNDVGIGNIRVKGKI